MLLTARVQEGVRRALRRITYRIPDGAGISLVARLLGYGKLVRHPGSDMIIDICRLSRQQNKRVLILGGWGTITKRAIAVLKRAFPGIDVHGLSDVRIGIDREEWDQPHNLIDQISAHRPDVLAVALGGAGQERQERWIADHAHKISGLKLAIGIGGAIDMIAGSTPRAPEWMQKVGIEWFWRLAIQPRRAGRIFRAVFVFPIRAVFDRMRRHEA